MKSRAKKSFVTKIRKKNSKIDNRINVTVKDSMKKGLYVAVTVMALAAIWTVGAEKPVWAAEQPGYVRGQILVQFSPTTPASERARIVANERAALDRQIGSAGVYIVRVPAGSERATVATLKNKPGVARAGVDAIATALGKPVTPIAVSPDYFNRQYALNNIGQSFTNTSGTITIGNGTDDADIDAPEAWKVTSADAVKVAVLDTGVDKNHEDISSKVVLRANFTGTRSDDDLYGHGTHVAGIIAATHNTVGVKGVCPNCTIMSGKVLDDNGSGSESSIIQGIHWAWVNGAQVINMSLGFAPGATYDPSFLTQEIDAAWNNGAVIVAAAGNLASASDTTGPIYPAYYEKVIAVGATDNNDIRAGFSNYGSWVDVAAPGANVYSTFPNHRFAIQRLSGRSLNYDIASGTSMASPVVAGTVALTIASHPGADNTSVRNIVESTTENNDKYADANGRYWAYGRVNAYAAVVKAIN